MNCWTNRQALLFSESVRPLFHPALDEISVEGVLHALSDPVRVAIYAGVAAAQCPQTCSSFLRVSEKSIPKSTLSQHFKALREAGLIRSERCGVEMHNTSRCAEIDRRFPGLIKSIINSYKVQLEGKARPRGGGKAKRARPGGR